MIKRIRFSGGAEVDFDVHVQAVCPCGRTFEVGEVNGVPCVLHAEPQCAQFSTLDVVDFLHWVNVQQGRWN